MAVGFNSVTLDPTVGSEGKNGDVGNFTFSHTVGAGSNRALYVCLVEQGTSDSVTSVKWDVAGANQTLTEISGSPVARHDDNTRSIRVFRVVAPASGTKLVSVAKSTSSTFVYTIAADYDDVDQTTPEEDVQTATGSNVTSLSETVTSTSGAATLLFGIGQGGTVAASTGTTNTRATPNATGNAIAILGDTLGQTAGAHSMAFTLANHDPSVIVFSVKSATDGGAAPPKSLALLGVG
jgi:hypothetical protein